MAEAHPTPTSIDNPKPPEHGPAQQRLRDILMGVGLLCLTLLFYSPALNGSFLFDDDRHVTPQYLWSLHGLWSIWFEVGAAFQYYPMLHTAFWVEHRLWGDTPFWYHLTNVLMHVTSACLLVAVLRRLALPGAWFAAYLFALHPVCVESVAWISEQKNMLSTVFYLCSALAYLRFNRKREFAFYLLATALFILALLSKTVTATLPGALLVVIWWMSGRIGWKRDVLPLLPWFMTGGAAGMFSGWMERKFYGAEGLVHFSLTFTERCMLACRAIWFYLGKLFWPRDLIFHYPLWKVSADEGWQWLFVLATAVLVAVLLAVALWRRGNQGERGRAYRGPLAGFLFFAGTLFPTLGFFNIGWFCFSYVADHFVYVASLGIIVPVAAGLTMAVQKIPVHDIRKFAIAPAVVLVLVLCSLTWHQSLMYRDIEALYQETLARNPDSTMTHYNYGLILLKIPGRLTEALNHFEETLRLKTDDAGMYDRVGAIFLSMNRKLPEAIADFEAALKLDPNDARAHYYLGSALLKSPDRVQEAIPQFEAALRIQPDFAEAECNLGSALAATPGRTQEAIAHFEAALVLNPNFTDAHYCLGNVLATIPDRVPDAIKQFEAAIRLQPDFADAHYCLANALATVPGSEMEAIAHYKEALRLRPDMDVARKKLEELRRR